MSLRYSIVQQVFLELRMPRSFCSCFERMSCDRSVCCGDAGVGGSLMGDGGRAAAISGLTSK